MLASRADVYTIRCSCKQWPCTYTAPCVARTCWEESQTHIAAPPWQRRSTHPARALMHAANAPRRGRSCTDQQHHTPPQHRQQNAQHYPHAHDQTAPAVSPDTRSTHPYGPNQTPSRPRWKPCSTRSPTRSGPQTAQKPARLSKPDRLFLLHDGAEHRPTDTIGKNHTARPPPMLHAASMFRRGDYPQIGQGENHQHDHSPTPNKNHPGQRPALEADCRPRREQQPPRPRSDRPTPARRPAHVAPVPAMGKPPADTARHIWRPYPNRPQISPA